MLDTDIIVYLLRGNRSIADRIAAVGNHNVATTTINVAELYFGAFTSNYAEDNVRVVDTFRQSVRILPVGETVAVLFGQIKAELKRTGQLVNDSDLLIAAAAVSVDGVLVTNNIRHFSRIDNLIVENWLSS